MGASSDGDGWLRRKLTIQSRFWYGTFISRNICFLLLDVLLHMSRGALLTERDRTQFADQCEMILVRTRSFTPPPLLLPSIPPSSSLSVWIS